jgi:hypothetical protein
MIAKGVAFTGGQEAVQHLRVLADHEMRQQADPLADDG